MKAPPHPQRRKEGSPRVAVVDPSFFTLPYDQHLCEGLLSAGVDVSLFGRPLRAGERLRPAAYPVSHEFYRRSERPGYRAPPFFKAVEHLAGMRALGRSIRAGQMDLLHAQWSPVPLIDSFFWRRWRRELPLYFTVHDTQPFLGNASSRLQVLGWRRLLNLPHRLIVHTEKSREDLVAQGVARARIYIVPHGLLLPSAAPNPAPERRTILMFGEIKPYKGIDRLFRALSAMPRTATTGWNVIVAGRPRMPLEELKRLASATGMPVEFRLGFLPEPELVQLIHESAVLAFPYRAIDASGALMLAMALGKAIVASRLGNFAETLVDGRHARLVDDDAGLVSALQAMLSDAALRQTLARELWTLGQEHYGWTRIGARYRELYAADWAQDDVVSSKNREVPWRENCVV